MRVTKRTSSGQERQLDENSSPLTGEGVRLLGRRVGCAWPVQNRGKPVLETWSVFVPAGATGGQQAASALRVRSD